MALWCVPPEFFFKRVAFGWLWGRTEKSTLFGFRPSLDNRSSCDSIFLSLSSSSQCLLDTSNLIFVAMVSLLKVTFQPDRSLHFKKGHVMNQLLRRSEACNSGFRLVKSMPGWECIQQHHLMIHLSQNSSGLTKTGKAFFGSADLRLASVLQTTQQKKWHKWEIWFMSPLAHISCSTDEVHKVRFHIEGTERRTWETPRPLRGAFKLDFLYLLIFGTFYTRQYLYLYKDFFVLNWRVGVKKIKWVDGNVSLCVFV